MPYSHWCILTSVETFGIVACLYISAWGFGVARFDYDGQSYEPKGVERATVQGFTLEPELNFADIDYQYVTSDDLMH